MLTNCIDIYIAIDILYILLDTAFQKWYYTWISNLNLKHLEDYLIKIILSKLSSLSFLTINSTWKHCEREYLHQSS